MADRYTLRTTHKETAMQAWNVYLNGKLMDTVFYDPDCKKDYVLNGLINHDGYDPAITIKKKNKYK